MLSTNSAGYGQLKVNGYYWTAHRYAAACTRVLKPTDIVRHICHNTKCCNPDHLVIGTHKDNYHDSRDIHAEAAAKRRSTWLIDGVSYPTCREVTIQTGISQGALNKHMHDGVFDIDGYRKACTIANKVPKV